MYYFPLIFRLLPKFGSMCVYWYVFWRLWSNYSRYDMQILGKVSSYQYLTSVLFYFFEKMYISRDIAYFVLLHTEVKARRRQYLEKYTFLKKKKKKLHL